MSGRGVLPMVRMIALTGLAACALLPAPTAAAHTGSLRAWKQNVSAPAQFDLTLAEVRFRRAGHAVRGGASRARLARSIHVALAGPTGLDYVAAAATRFGVRTRPRLLVLVINRRPRGSLAPDLARIGLTVTAPRSLGAPRLSQVSDPFTRPPPSGAVAVLCDLRVPGPSLSAAALRPLLRRGAALAGFSAQAAIAQAYNAVCGKPYEDAFRRAVTRGSLPTCEAGAPKSLLCCPPNAICAPPPCATCPCQACDCSPCACATCPCQACACTCGCPPCGCTACACANPPCLAGGQSGAGAAKASIACPLQATPIVCPL